MPKRKVDAITTTVVNQAITTTVVNQAITDTIVDRQSAVIQAIEEIEQARRARDPNQCLVKRP